MLVWIVVIVLIILVVFYVMKSGGLGMKSEGFYSNQGYYKKYCDSCYGRNNFSCAFCSSCGICTTVTGVRQCTPGNEKGPFYRDDCYSWEYGDLYGYYPFSNVFPSVKTYDQYPRNIINSNAFRYKEGYNKYQENLRKQAAQTREMLRRMEHGLA
jgi:hypothetical protein